MNNFIQDFAIIAHSSEQPPLVKKWWQFWVRRQDFDLRDNTIIIYVNVWNDSIVTQVEDFLLANGIRRAIPSIKCSQMLNVYLNQVILIDSSYVFKSREDEICAKACSTLGIKTKESTLMYVVDNCNDALLTKYIRAFKNIFIVVSNPQKIALMRRLTAKLFIEYGLEIDVLDHIPQNRRYDFAIISALNFNRDKISKTVNNIDILRTKIDVEINEDLKIDAGVDVGSAELAVALKTNSKISKVLL
ncbi:MAG: hypothetical protein LBM38_00715 [Clostridiales bacterium]|nr:hypothetical protein [Clostridiales bacterium]